MKSADMKKLELALSLQMQREQVVYRRILAMEATLREKIACIRADTKRQMDNTGNEMRALGIELLWRKQAMDQVSNLNMQLAQVLADKERHRRLLRKSVGRHEVSKDLVNKARSEEKRRVQDAMMENALAGYAAQGPLGHPDTFSR